MEEPPIPEILEIKLELLDWGCGAKLKFNEPVEFADAAMAEELYQLSIDSEPSTFGTRRLLQDEDFRLKVEIASDGKSIIYKAVLIDPYNIGVGNKISKLKVKPAKGDTSFLSGKNGPLILPSMDELPTLDKQLPAQVLEEDIVLIETPTEVTEGASKGSIVMSILLTLLIAGTLSLVWGLVGVLQNIAIMAYVNVQYPGNVSGMVS